MPKSQHKPEAPLLQTDQVPEAPVFENGDANGIGGQDVRPEERQEFFLPVWGFVWFFPEEVKIVDHLV